MNRKIRAGAMLALTLGLAVPALSGCSNGASDRSKSVESDYGTYPQAVPPIGEGGVAKEQGADAARGAGPTAGGADSVQRAVVTTISTVVEVPDVPGATARVIAATAAAKGYVQAQYSTATTGKSATTTLTVRIPSALADQFLASVASLGTVTSTERSSDDVTAEVADIEARLANAKAGVVRLRALMAKATKVSDIVAIESALSERQAEAESLAAQQRVLADMTSLTTITVVLTPAPDSPPTGFVGGLAEGWNAFTSSIATLARAMGYLAPFAIVGLLLVGLAVVVVRSMMRRKRQQARLTRPAPTQPAAEHQGPDYPAHAYAYPSAQADTATTTAVSSVPPGAGAPPGAGTVAPPSGTAYGPDTV